MSDTPLWQRLQSLRPSLPRHIAVQRRDYQGERWFVLHDKSNGRFHRLTPSAWRLLTLMNGRRSLQNILELSQRNTDSEESVEPDDIIHLLQYLHVADLLICDIPPSARELFSRRQQKFRQPWLRLLMNPLMWNIPLGNPDRLLNRLLPFARWLASPLMALLWLAFVAVAMVLSCLHWEQLTHGHLDRLLSPGNLFMLWLTYPALKVFHELGHGLFTKVWGGQVYNCGIIFIAGMPLPYVDASAALGFPVKSRRLMVTAAGIAVELFIAALALLLWLAVEPGLIRDFLYNLMLIGSVSTLFFNGNPLARFDGYHLLADILEIPNLATRANRQLSYLVRRYLFAIKSLPSPASNRREAIIFPLYALAAFVYRLGVFATIIFLVAHYAPQLALPLALWLIAFQLLLPLVKFIRYLCVGAPLAAQRKRAISVTLLLVVPLLAAFFWLPLPLSTRAQGVLWLPQQARIKAGADGAIVRLAVADGAPVKAGQLLAVLDNPALHLEQATQQAQLREISARFARAWGESRSQAQLLKKERESIKAELANTQEQIQHLHIRSQTAGVFRQRATHQLVGSYLHQGDTLGVVVKPVLAKVRVALTQEEVGLIDRSLTAIEVRFAAHPEHLLKAKMIDRQPVASMHLPSAALGAKGGGDLALAPEANSATQVKRQIFVVDLTVPHLLMQGQFGERVYVRFQHKPEPLYYRLSRLLQQLFIRRFS